MSGIRLNGGHRGSDDHSVALDSSQPAHSDALPVLWICGPPGAGKSATAWSLFEIVAGQGAAAAYLDIDQLGMFYPESDNDPDGFHLKTEALNALIPNYRASGAQVLIVSGILDPHAPGDLASQYPAARVTFALLNTDDAAVRERILRRGWEPGDADHAVSEARLLREAAFVDATIDTIGASVEQVAERVRPFVPLLDSRQPDLARPHAASTADADLIVLTGPRAVGTSTVGFALASALWNDGVPTGFADLDQLAILRTHAASGNHSTPLGVSNVSALHEVFAGRGATRLIISAHLYETSEHRLVRAAVPDGKSTVFRLRANEETLAGHIRERAKGSTARLAGDDLVTASSTHQDGVVQQALQQQAALDARADQDILIEVTGQSVDTVINGILTSLAMPPVEVSEDEVTFVRLVPDRYGGPFWDDEGSLSADFENWEPLGMSRSTYDACTRWCESPDEAERASLVVRLRQELSTEIDIE